MSSRLTPQSSEAQPSQRSHINENGSLFVDSMSSEADVSAQQDKRSASSTLIVNTIPRSPTPQGKDRRGFRKSCWYFWDQYRAMILVFISQAFGSFMNLSTRLLEVGSDNPMHPMEIMFVRMAVTLVGGGIYMWWVRMPDGPLGPGGAVRWLLVVRGVTGFLGIYGIWFATMYIPLADATVITFLAPCLAGYLFRIFLGDSFTWKQQVASLVALAGVVLVARPASLFSSGDRSSGPEDDEATPGQRLAAIIVSLVGVVGSALSLVALRWLGTRAHPLHSVNYFAVVSTVVSVLSLTVAPATGHDNDDPSSPPMRFILPGRLRDYGLLVSVSACGFILQILLAMGMAAKKGGGATAMLYTQILFATAFDRFIFGHTMGWMSAVGCIMVIGGAMGAAFATQKPKANDAQNGAVRMGRDEEEDLEAGKPLLGGRDDENEGDQFEDEFITATEIGTEESDIGVENAR